MFGKSINWNAGIHAQFLFPYSQFSEVVSIEAVVWVIKNIFIYIQNFFVSNQNNVVVIFLSTIFMFCCSLGLVKIHKRENLAIVLYVDISGIIFFLLILMRKFCLAPSRHLLLFYPVLLLLFCYGCNALFELCTHVKIAKAVAWIVACMMLFGYIQSSLLEFSLRQNFVLSGEIEEFIQEHRPDMIVAYYGLDFYLISFPDYVVAGTKNPLGMNSYKHKNTEDAGTIMLIGIGRKLDEESLTGIRDYLNYISEGEFLTETRIKSEPSAIYEVDTGAEVEYARNSFFNFPNGLYMYFYGN